MIWCKDYTHSQPRLNRTSRGQKWSIRDENGDSGLQSIQIDDILQKQNAIEAYKTFCSRVADLMPRSACCSSPLIRMMVRGCLINDPKTTSSSSWSGSRYPPVSEQRAASALKLISSLEPHEYIFAAQIHGPRCSTQSAAYRANILAQLPGALLSSLERRVLAGSARGSIVIDGSARRASIMRRASMPPLRPQYVPPRRAAQLASRAWIHSSGNSESSSSTTSGDSSTVSPSSIGSDALSSTNEAAPMDVASGRPWGGRASGRRIRRRRLVHREELPRRGRSFNDDDTSVEEGDVKNQDGNDEGSDSIEVEVIMDHGESGPSGPRSTPNDDAELRTVAQVTSDARRGAGAALQAQPSPRGRARATNQSVLMEMGFSEIDSRRALRETRGNLVNAIQLLAPE